MVSAPDVAGVAAKARLQEIYGADAVDMEAAVVAEIARAAGVEFMAVKAISDPLDFEMPPMERFIDSQGRLDLLKLIGWASVRPSLWAALAALKKNSHIAAEALATELEKMIAAGTT